LRHVNGNLNKAKTKKQKIRKKRTKYPSSVGKLKNVLVLVTHSWDIRKKEMRNILN
jgi:hypothetical protein